MLRTLRLDELRLQDMCSTIHELDYLWGEFLSGRNFRHRGRTASYPTAPAQIPACGTTAPGSSKILAFRSSLRHRRYCFNPGSTYYPWSFDFVVFNKFLEALPIVTLPLATLVELSPQQP
jgi:hypothetical protein